MDKIYSMRYLSKVIDSKIKNSFSIYNIFNWTSIDNFEYILNMYYDHNYPSIVPITIYGTTIENVLIDLKKNLVVYNSILYVFNVKEILVKGNELILETCDVIAVAYADELRDTNLFDYFLTINQPDVDKYFRIFFNMILKGYLIYSKQLPCEIDTMIKLLDKNVNDTFYFVGLPITLNDQLRDKIKMELLVPTYYKSLVIDQRKRYNKIQNFLYPFTWNGWVNSTELIHKIESIGDTQYGKMLIELDRQNDNVVSKYVDNFRVIGEIVTDFFNQTENHSDQQICDIASKMSNEYLFSSVKYIYVYRMERIPLAIDSESKSIWYNDIIEGQTIVFYKPTSTSYTSPPNEKFGGDVCLRFRLTTDIPFICIDGMKKMSECEILLPSKLQFTCIHKWYDYMGSNQMTYIDFVSKK